MPSRTLTPRMVRVLASLIENGPHTRNELRAAATYDDAPAERSVASLCVASLEKVGCIELDTRSVLWRVTDYGRECQSRGWIA